MSDGATGGAPAGGAAPAVAASGATPTQTAPKTTEAKTPKTPAKPEAPSWSEKDDADFVERLKRSPYSKLRVDGKDEVIDSIDAFKRTLLDAQRGKGANRVVEQTKKEAAEAKAAKEEAAAIKHAIERARKGDKTALRELGLIPDEERIQAEQEWQKLPPEVQEIARTNYELAERLRQVEEEKAAELRQREETAKKQQRDETLKRAKELSASVLKDVKAELYDVELPEVLLAMETLKAAGSRLGVDYTPEQLAAYIEQQREASVWERVGRTKPDVALKRLSPILKSLKPGELRAALGDDFPALGKLFAAEWMAYHQGKKDKPAVATGTPNQPAPAKKPEPLDPRRFIPRRER